MSFSKLVQTLSICKIIVAYSFPSVDFNPSPVTVVSFTMSSSDTQCIDITIVNDNVVEPEEDFTVELSPISPFVDIGTTSSAVITLTDGDSECL